MKFLVMLTWLLFSGVASVRAAVTVQSTVDRNELGLGDTVTLSVSVGSSESVDVQEPRIPNIAGFDLVNSWNASSTSSRLVQGNGGMQFETVRRQDFNYMLTPQKAGTLTIPGFEVVVEGKTYTTKPIAIKVSPHGSGAGVNPPGLPQQDEMDEAEQLFDQLLRRQGGGAAPPKLRNLPRNPNEAFFIQCDVDKTDVYEGEQIVVNWYIYTRGNIISLDRLKFPDLKGFWKEIIEEVPALNFTQEVINGIPYRRALLASHALFPIKPGTAVIDEYKIKAQVQLPTSPFGSFGFGKAYTYQKASERIKINVKPLPVEGKPSDFSGAVGQFDVRSSVEGNQFPVNQPFSFKVRFEGAGNAKLIELPSLNLPKTVEVYDTKADAKYFKNGKSYKEFQVLLIPREEGEIDIPEMTFSMFDPQQRRYVTRKTDAIHVKIIPNPNGSLAGKASPVGSGASAPTEIKKRLPDIVVVSEAGGAGVYSVTKWTLWGLLYLAIALILVIKARRELAWGQRKRDLKAELKKRLNKIDALIEKNEWRTAGAEIANAIYHILGEAAGTGGANVEIDKLLDLAPPSLRRELGDDLKKIIEQGQVLSFAPEALVGRYKEKAELKKFRQQVEKILLRALSLSEGVEETTRDVT
ncbi:MAG: protein BatD [Bdellovibrio sp. CG10_big_fil_rev_8_21_14_0_10_47_8]|nr:MAG: protein BatD [Bdellovibrio sp. CG10_big_fil_rev_8_21_14_0_10_47_8]